MHSNKLLTVLYSSWLPPTMNVSVAFSAPITPPLTGASTNEPPFDFTNFWTCVETKTITIFNWNASNYISYAIDSFTHCKWIQNWYVKWRNRWMCENKCKRLKWASRLNDDHHSNKCVTFETQKIVYLCVCRKAARLTDLFSNIWINCAGVNEHSTGFNALLRHFFIRIINNIIVWQHRDNEIRLLCDLLSWSTYRTAAASNFFARWFRHIKRIYFVTLSKNSISYELNRRTLSIFVCRA